MKKILSYNSKYNVYNMLIAPTIFILLFGYFVDSVIRAGVTRDWDIRLAEIIGAGYFYMIFVYYPQKIIVMLYKGIINKKWEWGHSYEYWIFTVILTLFSIMYLSNINN